jgi:hypothetical protein
LRATLRFFAAARFCCAIEIPAPFVPQRFVDFGSTMSLKSPRFPGLVAGTCMIGAGCIASAGRLADVIAAIAAAIIALPNIAFLSGE